MMALKNFKKSYANLKKRPGRIRTPEKAREQYVTLGDLHGNTLKLIHFLCKQAIIIPKDDTFFYEFYEYFMQTEKNYAEIESTRAAYLAHKNSLKEKSIKNNKTEILAEKIKALQKKHMKNNELSTDSFSKELAEVLLKMMDDTPISPDDTDEDDQELIASKKNELAQLVKNNEAHIVTGLKKFITQLKDNPDYITKGAKFRSMGDNFMDRNGTAIDLLEIYALLIDHGVKIEILASNHDVELMIWLEKIIKNDGKFIPFTGHAIQMDFATSGKRLSHLIKSGKISIDHVIALYKKCRTAFELLFYDQGNENCLLIYGHAPFNENIVLAMANGFYHQHINASSTKIMTEETQKALLALCQKLNLQKTTLTQGQTKRLIELINDVFRYCITNNQLIDLWRLSSNGTPPNPFDNPFEYIIWNRRNPNLYQHDQYVKPKNLLIAPIYGHHSFQYPDCITLDNLLGKEIDTKKYFEDYYLYCQSTPALMNGEAHLAYEARLTQTNQNDYIYRLHRLHGFLKWLTTNEYVSIINMHRHLHGYAPTEKLRHLMPALALLVDGICRHDLKKLFKNSHGYPETVDKYCRIDKEVNGLFFLRPNVFSVINEKLDDKPQPVSGWKEIEKSWMYVTQKNKI